VLSYLIRESNGKRLKVAFAFFCRSLALAERIDIAEVTHMPS
jgi:hypothetical protein